MHHAELVWVTPDAEKLIGKIARKSNPNNEDNPNVEGLIRYLINTSTGARLKWLPCASRLRLHVLLLRNLATS